MTGQEMHAQVSVLDDEQLAIALSTATNDFAEQVRVMDERERAYLALGKGTEARAAAQASYHEASNQTNCQSQWLTALRREQEYRRAERPRGPGRPRIHQEPRQDVRVSLPVDLIAQMNAATTNRTAFIERAIRAALAQAPAE